MTVIVTAPTAPIATATTAAIQRILVDRRWSPAKLTNQRTGSVVPISTTC